MRLLEFQDETPLLLKNAIEALGHAFKLERVGGNVRVYHVGSELGVVFLVNGGPKAIGLTWKQGSMSVSNFYLWNEFNAARSPDLVAAIPNADPHAIASALIDLTAHPHRGIVEAAGNQPISVDDFLTLVREKVATATEPEWQIADLTDLTIEELEDVAQEHNVQIPEDILKDEYFSNEVGNYDLSGTKKGNPRRFYLNAKTTSVHFEVPGVTKTDTAVEKAFAKENGATKTMEEQYDELREKVSLVAGNKSNYIKSLLITGAPSSGKTFTVMETVKELGLQEGTDYIVVKGSITDAALYLTFIEQIDHLTIFDDCDSVVETKDGKNMLKNALDTYPVRDIGRPNANSTNTKHLSSDERERMVNAISRILRGEPRPSDLTEFEHLVPKAKDVPEPPMPTRLSSHPVPGIPYEDQLKAEHELLKAKAKGGTLTMLQNYFKRRPPNRIDFKGRIIFISNMDESDWDSAILTRAFRVNMNFDNGEMLDFIMRIKKSIAAPGLSDEQKDEVLAYIRELHDSKQLKSRINFRLIQQAFDLRLCSSWKSMVASL